MNNPLFEQFLKSLILGKDVFVNSTSVYKRAILTGTLSFLLLLIACIHLIFDLSAGVYVSAPFYFILFLTSFLVFFLNRTKRYQAAKVVLLYTTLVVLYILCASEPPSAGGYLHYFPLILAAFALYGYKHRIYAVIFSLVALGSFFLINFLPVNFITWKPLSEEVREINLLINFVVSLGATFFIIMFFIKLNYTIENYLKNNEIYQGKLLEELEASKQRMELAFKGSNAGLYDWDIQTDNVYHSSMWKQILGYDGNDFENFTIGDFFRLVHPEDRGNTRKNLDDYLQSKSKKFVEEVRIKTKDGAYKWIMDSGMALWDNSGTPVRMVGSIIDITEIKEAEARIKEQNRMLEKTNAELDKFVYSTSHDLRAPLMSILGLIELAKTTKSKTDRGQCLDLMANRVHRLDEFIAEIIDFSRNSRLEVANENIKLDAMLREIIKDLQYIDHSERITLNLNIDDDFCMRSDRKRIEIILKNLISNAYKYHNVRKQHPHIIISAMRVNGVAKIMVEDNGDGIKGENHDRIFDMFFRGSEKSKGSGLGLYIAKEMTDKLGGRIRFESRYGEGSKFTIEIPQV